MRVIARVSRLLLETLGLARLQPLLPPHLLLLPQQPRLRKVRVGARRLRKVRVAVRRLRKVRVGLKYVGEPNPTLTLALI